VTGFLKKPDHCERLLGSQLPKPEDPITFGTSPGESVKGPNRPVFALLFLPLFLVFCSPVTSRKCSLCILFFHSRAVIITLPERFSVIYHHDLVASLVELFQPRLG